MKPPTSSHSMTWITPSFLRGTIEIPRSPSRCLVTGGLVVLLVTTRKLQITRSGMDQTYHTLPKNHGDEHPASSSCVKKPSQNNRVPRSRKKKITKAQIFQRDQIHLFRLHLRRRRHKRSQTTTEVRLEDLQLPNVLPNVLSFQKLPKFTKILGKIA